MTYTFPVEKEDFTAENGVTYTWVEPTHWRVKSFKSPDGQTVIVGEERPEDCKVGQLWFCTANTDETLYILLEEPDTWVPASPPVSLDGITEYTEDLQRQIMTLAKNQTPYEVFLDSVEKTKKDQDRQDQNIGAVTDKADENRQNIITLQEEIEQLVPSLERGIWKHGGGKSPQKGEYILLRKFTYEQLTQNCNDSYQECVSKCDALDTVCLTACNRAYDACKSQYKDYEPTEENPEGGGLFATSNWEDAVQIQFHVEDSRGTGHTFEDVKPDMYMDIFNTGNDGFLVATIEDIYEIKDDIQTFDIKRLQSRGQPFGEAGVKFFTVESGIDVTNYVRKSGDTMAGVLNMDGNYIANVPDPGSDTDAVNKKFVDTYFVDVSGDTMTGTLNIDGPKSNLRIQHIPPMGSQGSLKHTPLIISRDKTEEGSIARFQLGEATGDGSWNTDDVLKINSKGQLECMDNRIIEVGDPEAATDAMNLRSFEDRGGEMFVRKDGDTIDGDLEIKGRLDIKQRQNPSKPDNSFYIQAPMWNETDKEYKSQVLLKDYRPSKEQKNGQNSSVWYYGESTQPQHLVNRGWIEEYVKNNGGGGVEIWNQSKPPEKRDRGTLLMNSSGHLYVYT